jgi:hypothetical protein
MPNGRGTFWLILGCLLFGAQILPLRQSSLPAQARLELRDLLETVALAGETHHVQGIEVEGSRLWVSSVDRKARRGLLLQYKIPEGTLVHSAQVQQGVRFHPGGISVEGDSIWVPVAEYVRNSTTTVQKRSKQSLELESEFEVADHIGAIAVVPEGLLGANWDARDFYLWDKQGNQLRKFANPHPVAIQDMKFIAGRLVAGGLLLGEGTGVVDWLEWPSLKLTRRISTGKTDRGIAYTNEGMTVRDGKLWVLPEDAPSRLFVFRLSQ